MVLKNHSIQIRDPFIFPNQLDGKYYLYGSTDKNIWGKGTGFDVYIGTDLENWEGPFPVFRANDSFYSEENFWAPEVHEYQGKYYMFTTFLRKDNQRRGTAILCSERLIGPFEPHSIGPITPKEWDSLDGTLFVDKEGQPWMIFCHEWVEVADGEICAIKLSDDLKEAVADPILLFRASEASWPTAFSHPKRTTKTNYVTDGPFIYQAENGDLLMLWASFINNVYAQGISRSLTGNITGPWVHDEAPIYKNDGGHGMIFQTFNGILMLTLHSPNESPNERPKFIEIIENKGRITVLDNELSNQET